MKKRILVMMSTYNGEKYIKEQIDSILSQEGCTLHLLIRDDGSNDGTIQIIKEYQTQYSNITLSRSSGINLKPAASFLTLAKEASEYDYYAFADQDDIWHKEKLATAINRLNKYSTVALYCGNAELVDADGNSLGRLVNKNGLPTDYKSAIMGCGYLGCTMVINDALMKLVKKCNNVGSVLMHDQYVACVCAANKGMIFYDYKPYIDYRQHETNVVGVSSTKSRALKNRIKMLTMGHEVSIAETAKVVLDDFPYIDSDLICFLKLVANYKKSITSRVRLAIFERYSFGTWNMTMLTRLMVLTKKA